MRPGYVYAEEDSNPVTKETAASGGGVIAYLTSKTFAEQAAWNYVKDNRVSKTSVGDFRTSCCLILDQPNFDVTTLLPPLVYGPVIHHVRDVTGAHSTHLLVTSTASLTDPRRRSPTRHSGHLLMSRTVSFHLSGPTSLLKLKFSCRSPCPSLGRVSSSWTAVLDRQFCIQLPTGLRYNPRELSPIPQFDTERHPWSTSPTSLQAGHIQGGPPAWHELQAA